MRVIPTHPVTSQNKTVIFELLLHFTLKKQVAGILPSFFFYFIKIVILIIEIFIIV